MKTEKTKKENIGEIVKKYPAVVEVIVSAVAVTFLIYLLRSMLLLGETTLVHDNLFGAYPSFQFFAENIINGRFPFWDPFNHGGEPFYPLLGQTRLLEPTTLLTIYLGQFITNDLVILFNWNRTIQGIVMAFGVYIVFRSLAKHLFVRLSLIPILVYSSFILGSFRQDSILYQFTWIPYIAYFLLRIVYHKDYRWHNWFVLAGLIGLNWQSYFFAGTWVFLLFFSLGMVFFRRDLLSELFKDRTLILKLGVMVIIICAMAAPNIALMLEEDKYVFPTRMIDASYKGLTPQGAPQLYEGEGGTSLIQVSAMDMPYGLIAFSGTFSNIWDFIQMISPDGNRFIKWPGWNRWGMASEAYMYLGLLPWAIAMLGLVAGRHDMKKLWLLILLCSGLLMLGPPGGLHRLLYYTYPPMWFVRHTHAFVLFFIFALLYFYILGFNHLFSSWGGSLFQPDTPQGILRRIIKGDKACKGVAILIFSACVVMSGYWMAKTTYLTTDYLFYFTVPVFVVGWFLRKDLGERGLYVSLIASQIVIVLIFSTNTFKFVLYLLLALGLPLALFIFIKSRKGVSEGLLYYSPLVLLFVFSVILNGDLIYSLRKSSFLYQRVKHPGKILHIQTTPQKPFLLQNRLIYPHGTAEHAEYAETLEWQEIRYLPLLYRQPFVFSPVMTPVGPEVKADTFEYALKSKRWTGLFFLKKYYELINMDVPPWILERMFAVGEPMFQFKQGIVQVKESEIPTFLRDLGATNSFKLLHEYVIVTEQVEPSLVKPKISTREYNKTTSAVAATEELRDIGVISSVKEERKFTYTIEKYTYDSLNMTVFTDSDGILYWADGYDKNWHAYINGKEVPVYRANVNFKAVSLPKGANNVNFVYEPFLFKLGLFVFYGALIVCTFAVGIIKTFYFVAPTEKTSKSG